MIIVKLPVILQKSIIFTYVVCFLCSQLTLASWCNRSDVPRLGRTYSALLASRQRAAAARRSKSHPKLLKRLSTATTHLCEVPLRTQVRLDRNHYYEVWIGCFTNFPIYYIEYLQKTACRVSNRRYILTSKID